MSVLVLVAHPNMTESRANAALRDGATRAEGVTVRELYALYPDCVIDVKAEQAAVEPHDVIVFQHPLYWYSAPPLVKQWLDEVLEMGWAYDVFSPDPMALTGKRMASAVTTGAPASEYEPEGWNGRSVKDFLLPFAATAQFCGMKYEDPFVFYDTFSADDQRLAATTDAYAAWLGSLRG